MGAKFLCCLPLRLGVLVIAFLQFIVTAAVAGFAWWLLYYSDQNNLSQVTSTMKTSIILIGVIYTISALLGLIGFFGAVFKKLGYIRTFSFMLFCVLGLQIVIAAFTIISYYRNRRSYKQDCLGDVTNTDTVDMCKAWARAPQGVVIASSVIPPLIQAYACYIVSAYGNRLRQQKADRASLVMNSDLVYQPIMSTEEKYPQTHPNTTYPYADHSHSFSSVPLTPSRVGTPYHGRKYDEHRHDGTANV